MIPVLSRSRILGSLASVALILGGGCGSNDVPKLAVVHGYVELDGQPLAHARIEFNPVHDSSSGLGKAGSQHKAASGSFAITDEHGYYELEFGAGAHGAVLGEHAVKISTKNVDPDEPGAWRERVPAIYNVSSNLTFEVEEGENVSDFPLETSSVASR